MENGSHNNTTFYFALRGASSHNFIVLSRSLYKDFKLGRIKNPQYSNNINKNGRRENNQTDNKTTEKVVFLLKKTIKGRLKLFDSKGLERIEFLAN